MYKRLTVIFSMLVSVPLLGTAPFEFNLPASGSSQAPRPASRADYHGGCLTLDPEYFAALAAHHAAQRAAAENSTSAQDYDTAVLEQQKSGKR